MGYSGLFKMQTLLAFLGTTYLILNVAFAVSLPGESSYVAAAGFPTSVFSSYYLSPAQPTQQPQPIIYDPVLDLTFPYELTDPDNIPDNQDEVYFPVPRTHMPARKRYKLVQEALSNVTNIIKSNGSANNCTKCKNALAAAKPAALHGPAFVPDAMVSLCKAFRFHADETCEQDFATNTFGAILTQVLAYADVEGLDGEYICHSLNSKYCSAPNTSPLDTTKLFPKPKPADPQVPKASGERVKVLHLSDFHLDARYAVSSEANCTSSLCCRSDNYNDLSEDNPLLSASAYGSFLCDTPYDLGLAALQAVGPLTGTGKGKHDDHLAWTLYTGDLVSHDPASQISMALTQYTETSIYGMFKHYLSGPVFAALGNHDTSPANIDSPHNLPRARETADEARTHYGGYSVKTHYGLRILTFNTDLWYRSNFLTFINTTDPDNSGMFSWMIEELQKAEDAGERVWIVGHVLSGWDGTNPLPNPTDLFYQIVDRYSPHVIANIFFGHTHEDQFMVYYANNGTVQNSDNALTTGWIMPSITPLTNLNSGFRLYEVDTGDFNIYEAYTFYSNVSEYPALEHKGPTFEIEYSTRDAYGLAAGWDEDAPLNATFWHRVTEAMEKDLELVSLHNTYQGKQSVKSPNCTTTECQEAKVCYMRSGSVALGSQCPQGYGSVQSAFKAK
ncbi:hypothetical protein N7501_003812 [Penicillium viridicatum]|nr:hypothetical protein N7501_003812 [Penicillium viridicatum]